MRWLADGRPGERPQINVFRPPPIQQLPLRQKPQTLDYLKALGPLALAVVAALQQRGVQFWALFALALVAFAIALAGPARHAAARRQRQRHDDLVARAAVPELRLLVRRFQELVDGSRNDTLEAIVRGGLQTHVAVLERIKMPSDHWLSAFAGQLHDRLRDQPTGLGYLMRATQEFHAIVHAYGDQCLQPIFKSLPPADRQVLLEACGRQLEAFRQRYMSFRDDYEKYVKSVLSQLHATPPLYPDLPRTQPLSG